MMKQPKYVYRGEIEYDEETGEITDIAPDWHPLAAIDNFILACGWTHEQNGFKAPEGWRDALAVHFGAGLHFSREVAAKLCIQYHEKAGISFAPNDQNELQGERL
jgi:hypothetical protein